MASWVSFPFSVLGKFQQGSKIEQFMTSPFPSRHSYCTEFYKLYLQSGGIFPFSIFKDSLFWTYVLEWTQRLFLGLVTVRAWFPEGSLLLVARVRSFVTFIVDLIKFLTIIKSFVCFIWGGLISAIYIVIFLYKLHVLVLWHIVYIYVYYFFSTFSSY